MATSVSGFLSNARWASFHQTLATEVVGIAHFAGLESAALVRSRSVTGWDEGWDPDDGNPDQWDDAGPKYASDHPGSVLSKVLSAIVKAVTWW